MSSKSFGPLQIISNPPSSIHPSDCQENSWREMWFFFLFGGTCCRQIERIFIYIFCSHCDNNGPSCWRSDPSPVVILDFSRQSFLCLCALGKRIILWFFSRYYSLCLTFYKNDILWMLLKHNIFFVVYCNCILKFPLHFGKLLMASSPHFRTIPMTLDQNDT